MNESNNRFYRIVFESNLSSALLPVQNPEGRFHHGGQKALYTSITPEGARLALGYYAQPDDPPRFTVELCVTGATLFDLRDDGACQRLGIEYNHATIRWQKERKVGKPATTWRISDAVRDSGGDGMIYPSSSRPDVFHMVLFRWNALGGATVKTVGTPQPCVMN